VTGAGLGRKQCGASADWKGLRERARLLKILLAREGFKFRGCGAGADKKFQPAQDSK